MDNYQRLGKFIALILRHKPSVIGIQLDGHGWADVTGLIEGIRRTEPAFCMETLEEVVRRDNKQRFSFSEDKTKIRANQGHSVPVDVEMEEAEPPEILFHGTAEKSAAAIEENGLAPMTRLYVHLSKDCPTAAKVGSRHGKPVLFRVYAGRMYRDGYKFLISANGVWQTKTVPPSYLDRMKDDPPAEG